ncbi:hypothetical protein DFQ59_102115 [Thioalbus denitrificans]|uniref:Uncharacterized protein n=1 Tax=Thioalbus denitrificans TaxID=547122 RepID=A0A369CEV2_9GAMM|nr:hypothetical protein DFQ59_102115 [Thioalbus denitrificans]
MADSPAERAPESDGTDTSASRGRGRKSKSMHDGVAVWCDCCSCEAEPYWAELAEEMGIELYNDYEDE